MHYLALILVSTITLASTVLAVKQGWVGQARDRQNEQIMSPTPVLNPLESPFADLKKPLYFKPIQIKIGQTEISVEQIGLQADGTLDTPSSWENSGWYTKSSKPGEPGNVIIDGHYDDNLGKPAAFWGLKSLVANDKVVIKDEIGRIFTYKVAEVFYVDIADPNRLDVFKDEGSKLTLVTCGGVWDPSRATYNRRLVVKAELEV